MALKEVAAKRFLDDILGSVYREGHWKVLILDHLSTRIISACCNMVDVMSKAITLVEALEKKRQPLTHLEAIYILIPNDKSVGQLIADFEKEPLYKAAHVFFLEKCPASLFSKLSSSKASKKIHTLQEANLAFLPYESKAFTLDYQDGFHRFYSESSMGKVELVDRIADQLATVCAMLGEYPSVRYRDKTILNLMHLGVKVLNDGKVKGPKHKLKRKVRYEEQYEVSRWVPVLQDILEYIASGDLSTSYCPYLKGKGSSSSTASASAYPSTQGATSSVRQRWNWIPQKDAAKDSATGSVGAKAKKDLPTIIVFIVGGMTFSEMRTIYEFVTASGTHDAIIGSTHILTPKLFLEQLKELRSFS